MTRTLRVASEAEAELAAAAVWYESKRTGLGVEFLVAIDDALERLTEGPEAFPIWRSGRPFRRQVVRRFPFVIFFTVSVDSIDVLAVAHTKRRPGYWVKR